MPEEIEVIGNARCAHGEGLGDLAGGKVAFLKHFEDAAASRIAEGFKEKIQWMYN